MRTRVPARISTGGCLYSRALLESARASKVTVVSTRTKIESCNFEDDGNPRKKLRSWKTLQLAEKQIDLKETSEGNRSKDGKSSELEVRVAQLETRKGQLCAFIKFKNTAINRLTNEVDLTKAKQVEEAAFLKKENMEMKEKLLKTELELKEANEKIEKLSKVVKEHVKLLEII